MNKREERLHLAVRQKARCIGEQLLLFRCACQAGAQLVDHLCTHRGCSLKKEGGSAWPPHPSSVRTPSKAAVTGVVMLGSVYVCM